jgi:hypothetical protein
MLNPRRLEERERKKVSFSVNPPPPTPEPISIPVPLPRSSSMGGLSSITKSISKQQEQVDELTTIIDHLKEIISKYENEIVQLKNDNLERDKLIKQYEDKYKEVEIAINEIWNS